MANTIEYAGITAENLVTKSSRYANSSVVYYSENKILTFATYKKTKYVASANDQVAVIPIRMQYRPDLVSKEKYGTVDFWWRIMEVNNIMDILDFKAGRTIILPETVYA